MTAAPVRPAVWLVLALAACAAQPARRDPAVARHLERAERAELARDHQAARRHYQAAIAAAQVAGEPTQLAHARRELAETLASWGELAEAEVELVRATELAPSAELWHDLGIVRHARGDLAGSAGALLRAKALAPADPRPRIALAALYWKTGDHARAHAEYRALLALELPDRVREKVQWALTQLAPEPARVSRPVP